MPSRPGRILLDTMVVGGIFAVSKKESTISGNQNKESWKKSINLLAKKARIENPRFIVPTSVCYELMTMNEQWHKFVLDKIDDVFFYAQYSITNQVLQKAAEYSYKSRVVFTDEKSFKSKSLDPITAAYSLIYKLPIITENQKDFCESHFEIACVEPIVLNAKINKDRRLLSLLLPRN